MSTTMDHRAQIARVTQAADAPTRPPEMHPQRYKRLLRRLATLQGALEALPSRTMAPIDRKRVDTQLRNRMVRIRRVLRLPVPHPPLRDSYHLGEAAQLIGYSTKTLDRWAKQGRVPYQNSSGGRSFARRELLRVFETLKI